MKNRKINYVPFLFLLPALIFLFFVYLYPLIRVFMDSFFTIKGGEKVFAGFLNYKNIFLIDTKFRISLRNNGILLLGVPILVFFALICAFVIYERLRGWKVFRTICFLPYVLAITVVSIVFSFLYRGDGIINSILAKIGLGILQNDWIGNTKTAIFAVLFVIIWHDFGFGMILFFARLMSLDKDLFEAAIVDGANWWQRLRYVTIPQLRSIIEFYTVICVITILAWSFNYIFSMTKGGPGNSTMILEFYIYNTAFMYNLPNYASGISVVLFFMVSFLIIIQTTLRMRAEK
jgi:ABC-type sugar transport system permease subunit